VAVEGGRIWCWGYNAEGALGQGNKTNRSSPVQVGALTDWLQPAGGGYFTCAVKTDGTAWCWGSNSSGTLGDGTNSARCSPVQVGTLTTWSKISASNVCTSALKTDGTIWSWGSNSVGYMGDGTSDNNRSSPVQSGAESSWTDITRNGRGVGFGIQSA
jgi:alpha-tubulin suppressor-like RCC1 family protein